jgi:hypothetical protein
MKKKWILGLIFTNISLCGSFGQPTNSALFGPPLKIPLNISGGFGEIRTNHIHSGVDFRTGGEIGKTVISSADGFISRIKIEPGGFGKAIYIDHPEGYTTVYAHLDALRADINEFVKQKQYDNQLFPLDVFPKKTDFVIKRGDSIGFSGNSGSSQGPHLHFEIRETVKQSPLQPLLFKFPVLDTRPPSFYSLSVYPLSKQSMIAGNNRKIYLPVIRIGKNYTIKNEIITFSGPIGFGTEVFDAIDSNASRTGIYMLIMKIDSAVVYKKEIASFSFAESRYINSMIDYAEYIKSRKKTTKLYVDPNNKLSLYKTLVNKGIVDFRDSLVHQVEITAFDTYGNKSSLIFKVRFKDSPVAKELSDTCQRTLPFNKENTFTRDSFRVVIPLNALYNDLCLKFSERPQRVGYNSKIYQIGDSSIPFQFPFEISIKPTGLTPALMEKALLVRLDNNALINIGGTAEKDYIKGRTYIMGSFAVTLDTTPPRIAFAHGFSTYYQGIRKTYIAFKITDNLSRIRDYSGFIDGQWALFEYDAKRNLLIHELDTKRFRYTGNTSIRIEVSDSKNNKSTLQTKYRP